MKKYIFQGTKSGFGKWQFGQTTVRYGDTVELTDAQYKEYSKKINFMEVKEEHAKNKS